MVINQNWSCKSTFIVKPYSVISLWNHFSCTVSVQKGTLDFWNSVLSCIKEVLLSMPVLSIEWSAGRNVYISNAEKSVIFFAEFLNGFYLFDSDQFAQSCFVTSTRFEMTIENTNILPLSINIDSELNKGLNR